MLLMPIQARNKHWSRSLVTMLPFQYQSHVETIMGAQRWHMLLLLLLTSIVQLQPSIHAVLLGLEEDKTAD